MLYMKFPHFRIPNNLVIDKKYKKPQNQRNLGSQLTGTPGMPGLDPNSQMPGAADTQPTGMNSTLPATQAVNNPADLYSQGQNVVTAQNSFPQPGQSAPEMNMVQRTGGEAQQTSQYQDPNAALQQKGGQPSFPSSIPGQSQAQTQQMYAQNQPENNAQASVPGQENFQGVNQYQEPENPAQRSTRQEEGYQRYNPSQNTVNQAQNFQQPPNFQNPPQPVNSGIPENIPSLNQVSQQLSNQLQMSTMNQSNVAPPNTTQRFTQNSGQNNQPQQFNQNLLQNSQLSAQQPEQTQLQYPPQQQPDSNQPQYTPQQQPITQEQYPSQNQPEALQQLEQPQVQMQNHSAIQQNQLNMKQGQPLQTEQNQTPVLPQISTPTQNNAQPAQQVNQIPPSQISPQVNQQTQNLNQGEVDLNRQNSTPIPTVS